MRQRTAAWLVLGISLGVAALVFVSLDRARDAAEHTEANATSVVARTSTGPALGEPVDETRAKDAELRVEESSAPQRAPVTSETVAVSAGPWLRAVARSDGQVIANADVYWNDAPDPEFESALRALGPDHARGPWPAGTRRFVTGVDGRVQLPHSRRSVNVVVFAPGRVGSRDFTADWSAVVTVTLTDVFYTQILTAAGEPVAGASVRCAAWHGEEKSDDAGRAVFEFLAPSRSESSSMHELVVHRALADDVSFEFPASAPCDSWKTLRLPRDGALRVNVPDAGATLGTSSGKLHVRRLTRVTRNHIPRVQVRFSDGTGIVSDIPFDLEYEVSVELDGVAGWLTARVPGPHGNSNGTIVHELRCADHAFGVLHLVDEQSRPIANTKVIADINAKWPTLTETTNTDANGTLYVLLEDHFAPGEPRRLWLDVPGKLTIGMELPGAFVPGVIDFGTLQLATDESADKSPRPRAPGARDVK